MNIQFPRYASLLNKPYRYKVLAGGRGSAKSYTVARKLLLKGIESKRYILCGREFQNGHIACVPAFLSTRNHEDGLVDEVHGLKSEVTRHK